MEIEGSAVAYPKAMAALGEENPFIAFKKRKKIGDDDGSDAESIAGSTTSATVGSYVLGTLCNVLTRDL
jgi:hypothetical protein